VKDSHALVRKNRSTLQSGKDIFDGRDSPGLMIALGQVD
jgi:hypothetical protein